MHLSKRRYTVPAAAAAAVLLQGLLGGCAQGTPAATPPAPASPAADTSRGGVTTALAALESRYQAHVGLFVLDTGTGRTVAYGADRRFAHCSTIKALAAGVLLKRESDTQLDQVITYTANDLVDYSPITSQHVEKGMTLRAVIAAALEYSDNTAENLMLERIGGPAALQRALRGMGDATTQVDREEPELNDATPGDRRDTSTARAFSGDLRAFLLGHELTKARRALLTDWMLHNTTGGPYIRAGVPAGWQVADKTGSGGYGTRNDVAVVRPPHRAPIVISVLTDRGRADAKSDDALIAEVTRSGLAALRD